MKRSPLYRRPAAAVALAASVIALASAGTATAASGTTSLTFKEPEKGSTFAFIDNAPTSKKRHGFPTKISPGDELVITNPLTEGGKTIGKLRARCTATSAANSSNPEAFVEAHFICEGVFSFGGSSLFANARILKNGTEGVVTGGTGKYAGARGTILSKEVKGGTTTTITLLE